MKSIVLFGAGASYGSGEIIPEPPSLGNKLFTKLASLFPNTWGALPERLNQSFERDFELGMEEMWNSETFSQFIPDLIKNMAYYFNAFRINPDMNNLYLSFIKDIKSNIKKIIFSTLNYDLLLEISLGINGIKTSYFSDTPNEGSALVWKLHGSPNFLQEGIEGIQSPAHGSSISYTSGIYSSSGLKAVDPTKAQDYCASITPFYPAMSLYMKSKINQIGHEPIAELQKRWKTRILNAKNVLIIGVKPYSSDTHIWDPLTTTEARIGYLGNLELYEQWINNGRDEKSTEFLGRRWEQCYEKSIYFINEISGN
jgi:hypothetical protein